MTKRNPRRLRRRFIDDDCRISQDRRSLLTKERPVTICIAAICDFRSDPSSGLYSPCIVGATDRMLTAGDIQFEPPTGKIFSLSRNVVALLAGDAGAQIEILNNTFSGFGGRAEVGVREAVDAYCGELSKYNVGQAEKRILAPYGMSMEKFLELHDSLGEGFADQLTYKIDRNSVGVATIVAGVDSSGAHIYTIHEEGDVHCHDLVAFAAIGDGEWHASSQFMFAKYTRSWNFSKAMLLAYSAKKRAEVAPGVGCDTDLFFIGTEGYSTLRDELKDGIVAIYDNMRGQLDSAVQSANQGVDEYVNTFLRASADAEKPKKEEAAPE